MLLSFGPRQTCGPRSVFFHMDGGDPILITDMVSISACLVPLHQHVSDDTCPSADLSKAEANLDVS